MMGLPFCAQGALVFEKQEIDVDARANEREVVVEYRFKNEGDAPVAIVDVVSNCDCTTMEVEQRRYRPGEKGTMTVRVAIEGRFGLQENTIAVITDDAPGRPTLLQLRAKIESLVTLSPPVLTWSAGAEWEEGVTLVSANGSSAIASLTITGTYPEGAAEARVETVAAGAQYRVYVRPNPGTKTRNLTVAFSAKFEDGTRQELAVHGILRK